MQQRPAAIVGSILLLAGLVSGLCLTVTVANAHLLGIFSTIVTDAPSNAFTALNCPLLLGRHETGQVSVSITNPAQDSLEYSVAIGATGLAVDAPGRVQTIVIAGHQTTTLAWKVTAIEVGNEAIAVQAVSKRDLVLLGQFHNWPTSFREGCGVFVMDTSLTGAQVMWLSGLGTLAGLLVIIAGLSRRWRPAAHTC